MFVWCYLPSYFRGELGTWLHEPGWLVHYAVMTGCRLDFYCLVPVRAGILYLPSLLSCTKVDMFIVIGSCWSLLYWNRLEGFVVFLVCLHTGSLTLTHWQFWRRTLLSLPLCLWNNHHYNQTTLWSVIQKMLSPNFWSLSYKYWLNHFHCQPILLTEDQACNIWPSA